MYLQNDSIICPKKFLNCIWQCSQSQDGHLTFCKFVVDVLVETPSSKMILHVSFAMLLLHLCLPQIELLHC